MTGAITLVSLGHQPVKVVCCSGLHQAYRATANRLQLDRVDQRQQLQAQFGSIGIVIVVKRRFVSAKDDVR